MTQIEQRELRKQIEDQNHTVSELGKKGTL